MKWMLKTTSVRVAAGRNDRIYRSIEDLPPELRRRIRETLSGPNAETLFIANQEAYDSLFQHGQEMPGEMRQLSRMLARPTEPRPSGSINTLWKGLLLGLLAALAVLLVTLGIHSIGTP